ncbi:MAG TPA: 1,6-anhydro-N-acetylmuramyl-L-alanine amidase AmpD [Burkholderiales bacterium]|nr:1,6-anhydro-N-acetylmuramyl-L-alanine amidase AmpD [Burkholderiales bacterium]
MKSPSPDALAGVERYVSSPNCDPRPAGAAPTLLVLHAISLPPGEYGGAAIERLFTNRLDFDSHAYFREIRGLKVSSHFLLRRGGEVVQFVPLALRAWHAGASNWRGRQRCNDFSVGVELEGTDAADFAPVQYARLRALIHTLQARLPLRAFAAHSDIAPGRKTDPGPGFDWTALLSRLSRSYI